MKGNDLLAIIVVAGALFWPQLKGFIPGGVTPGPAPAPVAVPDAQAQAAVGPLTAAAKASPDANRYARYWHDMAALVRLKPGTFVTTGDFKRFHETSSKLFFDLAAGATTGLAPPTETAITALLGNDETKLDDAKAIRAFSALEWACSQ